MTGDGPIEGSTVLISGGAGTVGYLAVQLARAAGAIVIATARPGADTECVLAAGAHRVVDYASEGLATRVLQANHGRLVDRLIEVEFGSNIDAVASVISPRGRIVSHGSALRHRPEFPFYELMFKGVRIELVLVYLLGHEERAHAIQQLDLAFTSGALKIPLHARYSLDDVAQAHEAVERGRRSGAVVVDVR